MSLNLTIFLICFCIIFIGIVYYLIRSNQLLLKYALLWICSFIVMIVAISAPNLLKIITNLLKIEVISNFIFFLSISLLLIIVLIMTSVLSKQKIMITNLVQEISILKKRINDNEK